MRASLSCWPLKTPPAAFFSSSRPGSANCWSNRLRSRVLRKINGLRSPTRADRPAGMRTRREVGAVGAGGNWHWRLFPNPGKARALVLLVEGVERALGGRDEPEPADLVRSACAPAAGFPSPLGCGGSHVYFCAEYPGPKVGFRQQLGDPGRGMKENAAWAVFSNGSHERGRTMYW